MEKAGRTLDGSASAEKKVTVYRASKKNGADEDIEVTVIKNKAGVQSVLISLNNFPMMRLCGSMPDENGEFFLTSLDYLSGSVHGWNEYSMKILGGGALSLGETCVLEINNEIENIQISSGRIHRYDTRINGAEALTSLRNRNERISATAEWMLSLDAPKGQTIEEFEIFWKPILLPETVSKNQRPYGWLQEGDEFVKAEDIRWNTGYTERTFSEELYPVRNSGTMLRDWEESLSWIYLNYEWENIKEILSHQIILQSVKK
ncbi:MAG: hypothetical protein LBI04_05610 [Treponema sp.]|nr:hypothetical protein [Treponema sp.]